MGEIDQEEVEGTRRVLCDDHTHIVNVLQLDSSIFNLFLMEELHLSSALGDHRRQHR